MGKRKILNTCKFTLGAKLCLTLFVSGILGAGVAHACANKPHDAMHSAKPSSADASTAAPSASPTVYPNSTTSVTMSHAPEGASQGKLFGIGSEIQPGDKNYNRGSMNPKFK